ncbi:MAG: hypothetical protein ACI9Y7_000673 [Dokdonia sp.]|jgi:hypothetical protein
MCIRFLGVVTTQKFMLSLSKYESVYIRKELVENGSEVEMYIE